MTILCHQTEARLQVRVSKNPVLWRNSTYQLAFASQHKEAACCHSAKLVCGFRRHFKVESTLETWPAKQFFASAKQARSVFRLS
jgi:hypothetical protein